MTSPARVGTIGGCSTQATTAGSVAESADSEAAETEPTADGATQTGGDSCAIVSADDVAAAFGGTVAPGVADPDNGGCDFDISGTTKTGDVDISAQISVQYGQTDYIDAAEENNVAPELVEVTGVGDAAWYLDLGHQLHVSVNGTELLVNGSLPGDDAAIRSELVEFATAIIANL